MKQDRLAEALDFIDSDTVRNYLKKLAEEKKFTLTDPEMISIVWNSRADIDSKQAFFLEMNDSISQKLVRRFEAMRRFLQERHEGLVYVMIINDRFLGVYNLYDTAAADFDEFRESFSREAEISLELYDPAVSGFQGRILFDGNFDITGFDLSQTLIEKEKLWEKDEADEAVNRYFQLPVPFRKDDIVTLHGGFDLYRVLDPDQPEAGDPEMNFSDIAVRCRRYDEEDPELYGEDQPEMLPLLLLEREDNTEE